MSSSAQTVEILDQTSTERMMAQAKEQVNGQTGGYWVVLVLNKPIPGEKKGGWLELREGGYLTEVEQLGIKWGRLDQPNKAGGFDFVYFHPKMIVEIIPCDEEMARAQALKTQYAPVRAWQALSASAGLIPSATGGKDDPIYSQKDMDHAIARNTGEVREEMARRMYEQMRLFQQQYIESSRGELIQRAPAIPRRFTDRNLPRGSWGDDIDAELERIYGFANPESKNPPGLPKSAAVEKSLRERVADFYGKRGRKP